MVISGSADNVSATPPSTENVSDGTSGKKVPPAVASKPKQSSQRLDTSQ